MKPETLHRVRVSVERSVPLDQVEPGTVLSRPARSEQTGQTVLPRGTKLNMKQIEKARHFDIERVMIRDQVRRWITGTLQEELYKEADYLETHEWIPPDHNGTHSPSVLEVFEEHENQNCGYFQLWLMDQFLRQTLREREDGSKEQELNKLEDDLEDLRKDWDRIRSKFENLTDPAIREELFRVLEGLIDPIPSYLQSLELPDNIRLSIQHYVERRDAIQSRLRDLWKQQQAREQEKLPPAETEPPAIQKPSGLMDWLRRGLSLAGSGRWNRGMTHFIKGVEREGGSVKSLGKPLSRTRDEWLSLNQDYNQLTERIFLELGSNKHRIVASELISGNHNISLKQLAGFTCSQSLLDSLDQYMHQRIEMIHQAWVLMQRVVFTLWQQIPEVERVDIRKKLTFDHESMNLKSSTQPWLYPEYQDVKPWTLSSEDLARMVRERDAYGLSDHTGLSESIARSVLHLYERPDSLEKWPAELIKNWAEMVQNLMFRAHLDMDQVHYMLQKLIRMIQKMNRPLHLIVPPPSADQHLLVHGLNQCVISLLIGLKLNLPRFCLTQLLLACALGDSGMSQLPESLILGDRKLSERGWEEVRNHPYYSRQWALRLCGPGQVVPRLVNEHHERVDGSGYPRGLSGQQQHPLSSILACADVYSALLEVRPHRPSRPPDQALETLIRSRKRHSITALSTLIETMGFYPNGCQVRLHDQRLALVKEQTEGHPRQPRIMIVTDTEGNRLEQGQTIPLSLHPDLEIQEIVKV